MNEYHLLPELRKALKSLVGFAIILVVLDQGFGFLLEKVYFSQKSGEAFRITQSLETVEPEILIVGSSCAALTFDPKMINAAFGKSTYNAGKTNSLLPYHLAVIKSAFRRYTPKWVVLNIDVEPFLLEDEPRVFHLIPYYRSNLDVRSVIDAYDPFACVKQMSKLYSLNSQFPSAFMYLRASKSIEDSTGFIPLDDTLNASMIVYSGKSKVDLQKIAMLHEVIRLCKSKNTKLIFTSTPCFAKFPFGNPQHDLARQIAISKKIPFFDYLTDTMFVAHPELFADPPHLNSKGAAIFTQKLIQEFSADSVIGLGRNSPREPSLFSR